jgi:hypothetical protein
MAQARAEVIRVGVLLYTYDRVDDARINMELIRRHWSSCDLLKDVVIVHAYNGREAWWPHPYLEDTLRRAENPGHFKGAELLINAGMETFMERYPFVTHVVILAADTWCLDPAYVSKVVRSMAEGSRYLATCAWGSKSQPDLFTVGMALDFAIVDAAFARATSFFPLRYQDFIDRYGEVLMYLGTMPYLERVFALRFRQAVMRAVPIPSESLIEQVAYEHLYHMKEREPVHYEARRRAFEWVARRRMSWHAIGLLTEHDPAKKRRVLKRRSPVLGPYGRAFLAHADVSAYNSGEARAVVPARRAAKRA